MRTAILAVLLAACAPASPPADGPAAGWLDVDDGRGPQPLTECTTRHAFSMGSDAITLYARAGSFRADAAWRPGESAALAAAFNDCSYTDGVTDCSLSGTWRDCTDATIVEANGVWALDMECDDGSHVTAEVTSCERL